MIEIETLEGKLRDFQNYISKEDVNVMDTISFPGRIWLVETEEQCQAAFEKISQLKVVGFDTESRPAFKKGQSFPVSLIQICGDDECWLFRLGETGFHDFWVSFFSDPSILKIGVAVHDDFRDLKKFKKFQQRGVVDFNKVGPKLGFKCNGLRRLSALVLGKKVSKAFQVSKWDEPLSEGQILYAATDAYVPLLLWEELKQNFDLKELDGV